MSAKEIYQSIINAGVNFNDPEERKYKLRALNTFSLYTFLIAILYGILFWYVDWKGPLLVVMMDYITFGSVIYLNYRRAYIFAKLVLVTTTAMSVFSITLLMGFESGFHLYLLTSPLFIFWLYDIKDVKIIIFSFFVYLMFFFVTVFFKDYYTPSYRFSFYFYKIYVDTYSLNLFINLIFLFVLFYNYSNYYSVLMKSLLGKQHDLENEVEKRISSEEQIRKILLDLSQSYHRVNQFNYIVSHNLRAPIANIKGFIELYDKNMISESQSKNFIEYISIATKNLDEVITDLNYIIQSNNQLLDIKEQVKLKDLIDEIKNILAQEIKASDIQIIETYDEEICIDVVRTLLHSVLLNILQNSIKYKSNLNSPCVFVDVLQNSNEFIIKISDNGIGIDLNKYKDQIFNLYSRFHSNVKQGKGIGLYLIKNHMEIIGGSIHIESKPNEGTTLFLRINKQ